MTNTTASHSVGNHETVRGGDGRAANAIGKHVRHHKMPDVGDQRRYYVAPQSTYCSSPRCNFNWFLKLTILPMTKF